MFGLENNFGFGFMRIPEKDNGFDIEQIKDMVDLFIESGFTYFDTAHGYCDGMSEVVLKECLVDRYPRSAYTVTDKLSDGHFQKQEDIRPLLDEQLRAVGVDYFDFWLMHAQDRNNYVKYKACKAYETTLELKSEGKIKHLGISFHDTPEVLDMILTENPQVEAVQLQFNYLDYDNPTVQSKGCYDICVKHNKPVIVMEPVRGGALANLPDEAKEIVSKLNSGSAASLAIRYAAGFDNVIMVLSGMSNLDMVKDNVSFMKSFTPLNEKELDAVKEIATVFRKKKDIPCTACRYCTERCPAGIPIPDIFSCINTHREKEKWNAEQYYKKITEGKGKASQCLKCGVCEKACPQHLEIRNLLEEAVKEFEIED